VLTLAAAHLVTAAAAPLSWFQAVVLGLLQGVTELFPISSLGHTVLFPTLSGWHRLVSAQSDPESFWLAFVVMVHVGSAVGLLRVQAAGPDRPAGQRGPRPSGGRRRRCGRSRSDPRALPDAVFKDPDAGSARHLVRTVRTGHGHLHNRLMRGN
jgi:Bacitracin resistance protein BacA